MRSNTKLSGALAALAVAAAIMAPAASARAIVHSPSPAAACDPSAVPPPRSSIAASAAREYAILRACGAKDLSSPDARDAADGRYLGMSSIRQDFRAPDTRDAANRYAPTLADSPPVEPTGFDWVSAAVGAAAGTGLMVLALALAVGGRRGLARPRHARSG